MKLFVFLFIAFIICGCDSTKTITKHSSLNAEEPTITISLLIETAYNQSSLNDVISACSHVKPFKRFSVNFVAQERMELKLIYGDISQSQRDELYNQVSCLGVKVINMSGY